MQRPQRPALSAESVHAGLAGSRFYTSVDVVAQTGSTNADLLAAARAGAAAGMVRVAEQQTAGRGRLDRSWQSQPGAALLFSVLLRPADVPPASRGWLPLLTGVAVASVLPATTGVDVTLKWPNDVLAGPSTRASGSKLAGILAEQASDAIVIGIGLNVSADQHELPAAQATSLWLAGGAAVGREEILIAILRELEAWYLPWANGQDPGNAESSGLRAAYLRHCSTLGRDVRVELPGGAGLAGRAIDVDEVGRLLVRAPDGVHPVSAGDVVHVRPGAS
jgi:BirA family biotin operon repressor/biotin-[acetyl-CoA-carboxylase] ligase